MTSNVKSWPPIFYLFFLSSTGVLGRAGARKTRRVILRLSVGCVPRLAFVRACRARWTRVLAASRRRRGRHHTWAVSPADGRRKHSEHWGTAANGRCRVSTSWALAHRNARSSRAMATTTGLGFARGCSAAARGCPGGPGSANADPDGLRPLRQALCGQRAREPIPARAGRQTKMRCNPGGLQLTETVSESKGWGPCGQGRPPRRGGLGRQRPRCSTLGGYPDRRSACEPGAWLTSEMVSGFALRQHTNARG